MKFSYRIRLYNNEVQFTGLDGNNEVLFIGLDCITMKFCLQDQTV